MMSFSDPNEKAGGMSKGNIRDNILFLISPWLYPETR